MIGPSKVTFYGTASYANIILNSAAGDGNCADKNAFFLSIVVLVVGNINLGGVLSGIQVQHLRISTNTKHSQVGITRSE